MLCTHFNSEEVMGWKRLDLFNKKKNVSAFSEIENMKTESLLFYAFKKHTESENTIC